MSNHDDDKERKPQFAVPIGIKDNPEPDGSHMVKIMTPDGATHELRFDLVQVHHFLKVVQEGLLTNTLERGGTQKLPILTLSDVLLAHGHDSVQLLGSTDQIGYAVLLASDDLLKKVRSEIDRLFELRQARARRTN